ncbi:Alpha/Beta hydrolase protein [Dactylonectria macrodidyma]|uniref:Carboxypeptidase n=1 Tax=Dactylonectria macrodidyma TaxID=307937 RepID=A0A9P9EPT7_9HYPO|nr:Alpha/Beta hydrolase protein [Dactylonectria macrodidyma]
MKGGFFTSLLLAAASGAIATYHRIEPKNAKGSIRVKSFNGNEIDLCDSSWPHHLGWADLDNDHHLFYWLHEARHDPETAPLLVWLQGGPGASSLLGAFLEHGPCLVDTGDSNQFNLHSWAEIFNMVYIDSPAGTTGFSYTDNSSSPSPNTTDSVASEVLGAIDLLYEAFPHLSSLPLHIAGESYGGHWAPAVGAAIVERNKKQSSIPLKSIIVGNGWTDPVVQTPSLFDVACHHYRGYEPYLDYDACAKMIPFLGPCKKALRECATTRDVRKCVETQSSCKDHITDVVLDNRGSNPYDRRMHGCAGDCYQPKYTKLHEYLGRREVLVDYLELSSASGGLKHKWVPEDEDASNRHLATGDFFSTVIPQLERVLSEGIDVLFYSGNADVTCNPKGVLEALEGAQWNNQVALIRSEWEDLPWETVSGGSAGRAKRVDGLWMVDLNEAGHLVPVDQPVVALELIREWRTYTDRGRGEAQGNMVLEEL